jgi:hypothetical protein
MPALMLYPGLKAGATGAQHLGLNPEATDGTSMFSRQGGY